MIETNQQFCGKMKNIDQLFACKDGTSMDSKTYRVCATCIHFQAVRIDGEMSYQCRRLNYETKPSYSFQCWDPKEHVSRIMEKRGDLNE